jgi:hypothetical protein
MPDVAKVIQNCDPAALEERQRKALAKVYEAGLIERLTPEPTPSPGSHDDAEPPSAAPSPWVVSDTAAELDKTALPSALAPSAVVDEPVTKAASPEMPRRRWPATWIVVLGCIGFMLAVGLLTVIVLLGRTKATGADVPAPSWTTPAPATAQTTPEPTAIEAQSTVAMSATMPARPPDPAATPAPVRERPAHPRHPKSRTPADAGPEAPAISPEFVQ